jgi:septal ring-binding cell division protein DamX
MLNDRFDKPAPTMAIEARSSGASSAAMPLVTPVVTASDASSQDSLTHAVAAAPAATPVTLVLTDAPKPAPGAPSPLPGKAARDLITSRLEATQQWLGSVTGSAYSIQLLVAGDEQQLRKHLKALSKFIEMNDLYMYRSEAHGRPVMNVLWGSFRDRQAANVEIAELPNSLRANRPYVRAVSAIRAELGQQREMDRP